MNDTNLKSIIEGFIFASDKAMSVDRLLSCFPENEQPEKEEIVAALDTLQQDYTGRGIELNKVSSGYRFQVRKEFTPLVSRLWEEKPARYTRALLETLALIVYRQPITRGEIEEIRGVAVSSNIIKTLQEREWIKVLGHKDVPGRPALYASTREFLDYFNLESLDQLPPLSEIKDLDTIAKELNPEENADLIDAINEMKAEALNEESASSNAKQTVDEDGENQADNEEENVEDIIRKAAELAASVADSTDQYIADSEAIISGKPVPSETEESSVEESNDETTAQDQSGDGNESLDSSEEAQSTRAEDTQLSDDGRDKDTNQADKVRHSETENNIDVEVTTG